MPRHLFAIAFFALLALASLAKADAIPAAAAANRATHATATAPTPAMPVESHIAQDAGVLCVTVLLVLANVALVALAVALDFRKSLSFDDADEWRNPQYRRALPNVLAILNQHRFHGPWPRRCNPWSMHHFERRLLRAIRPEFLDASRALVERHISLWIWLESHRDDCRRWLLAKKVERALEHLRAPHSAKQREDLLSFLHSAKKCSTQAPMDDRTLQRLAQLQNLQLIMREHGLNLSVEFSQADQLDFAPEETPATR